jgi:AAA domain, putative AbiEii toxin, Type IV TA system
MYFKHITLRNVGPIEAIDYPFPFNHDGNPKPLIIVGTNGSGKSVFLSHLLNSLMSAQQVAFEDAEVESGKVYKLRSPQYIKNGSTYSYSKVRFGVEFFCDEWQLIHPREEYLQKFGDPGIDSSFTDIPAHDWSMFKSSFSEVPLEVSKQFRKNCVIYFPANRFEQPAWLNEYNLNAAARFSDQKRIDRVSHRRVIQESPLNTSKNWLLDIIFDRANYELTVLQHSFLVQDRDTKEIAETTLPLFSGYRGRAENIWQAITRLVKLIYRTDDDIRLGIGDRNNRTVSIVRNNEEIVVSNIFQLSTGQSSILNIVLSILRDFDMSGESFERLEDVTGVVIIDEVDVHLHTDLQCNLLPEIISTFPKVQFILTTHSPLFLLGMRSRFSDTGFEILSMPTGQIADVEGFEEFQSAFNFYEDSDMFRRNIESELTQAQRPIIFFEGDYDVEYLEKAALLLGKKTLIEQIDLRNAAGTGSLDKIWKTYDNNKISNVLPRCVGLIFDCETNRATNDRGMVKKRVMKKIVNNPISKGIENLIPEITINRLRESHRHFFDVTKTVKTERGGNEIQFETVEINQSEKRHLCDWLCENGTSEDFAQFESVFTIIEEIIGLIQSEDLSVSVGEKPG